MKDTRDRVWIDPFQTKLFYRVVVYWFVYTDKAGQQLTGEAAYKAALSEGYFDLVVLHYGANANLAHAIDGVLRDGKQYEQIANLAPNAVIMLNSGFGDGSSIKKDYAWPSDLMAMLWSKVPTSSPASVT